MVEKKTPYWELLKDPRWQRKRLEIMQRDKFTCQDCCDDKSTLNVHHRYYVSGRKPWEYEDVALITLCENCHKEHKTDYGYQKWESDLEIILRIKDSTRIDLRRFLFDGFNPDFRYSESATLSILLTAMCHGMITQSNLEKWNMELIKLHKEHNAEELIELLQEVKS